MIWFAGPAHAHAALKSSVPAAASVGAAPSRLTLEFSHPVRLTSLALTGGQGTLAVTPLPKASAARIEVAAPKLAAGDYELAWRAVGSDGHVMNGRYKFTIRAPTAH